MLKIIAVIICLFLFYSIAYTQISDADLPKTVDYSESIPYEPTIFPNQKSKTKKEKKSGENLQKNPNIPVSSKNKTIKIPVSVFNGIGKFVTGLQKSDFKVFVDERELENFSIETKEEPLNIILLIDTSPSTSYRIEEIQNYALSVIENLKPQDKVLVAEFNEKLKILTELTNDKEIINKAVRRAKFGEGTSLYDVIQNLFEKHISMIEGRKALVLLTDGVDTTSRKSNYEKSLIAAEKTDVPVFPIYFDTFEDITKATKKSAISILFPDLINSIRGVGSSKAEYEIGKQYLNHLIRLSGGRVGFVENVSNPQKRVSSYIAEELRLKYYLKFTPSETSQTGQRKKIKVRVNRPNLFLLARGSFIVD